MPKSVWVTTVVVVVMVVVVLDDMTIHATMFANTPRNMQQN